MRTRGSHGGAAPDGALRMDLGDIGRGDGSGTEGGGGGGGRQVRGLLSFIALEDGGGGGGSIGIRSRRGQRLSIARHGI